MTRSTGRRTLLKTSVTVGVAALALSACGGGSTDAQPSEASSTQAATTETSAAPQAQGTKSEAEYTAALNGLTYHGEPLELGTREQLEENWSGEMLAANQEGVVYEPSKCGDLFKANMGRLNALTADASKAVFAQGYIENLSMTAQIWPGGASKVDLEENRELVQNCPSMTMADEETNLGISLASFPVDVPGVDTHGEIMTMVTSAGTAMLYTAYATHGDDVILVGSGIRSTDTTELEATVKQVVENLQ